MTQKKKITKTKQKIIHNTEIENEDEELEERKEKVVKPIKKTISLDNQQHEEELTKTKNSSKNKILTKKKIKVIDNDVSTEYSSEKMNNEDMFRGYVIADIHFGIGSAKELYNQLEKVFLQRIEDDEKPISLVVISGDLLDHKLSFNSEASKLCIEFITRLAKISTAKEKRFPIRILKGTRNHDVDQLSNFTYLQSDTSYDVRIINTVEIENIQGKAILYLPEEYMEDPIEYYSEYLNDEELDIDLCFFHGTFSHVEYASKMISSEKPIFEAPIFSYSMFNKKVLGPVIGGHIHIAQNYKKKIYYTGSFTRWQYGEEKPKGYIYFEQDINDSTNYSVKFIRNKYAKTYNTVELEDIVGKLTNKTKIEDIVKKVIAYKEENEIDNLRLTIVRDMNMEEEDIISKLDLTVLQRYFSEYVVDNSIKIMVTNKNSSINNNMNNIQDLDIENDNLEEEYGIYDFIFKKSYGIHIQGFSKTIAKYLEIKENITISPTIIEDILVAEEV